MSGYNIPGYDAWKLHDPADDRCSYCGIDLTRHRGWQPDDCTGECGIAWRDPDAERDMRMER